MSMPETNKINIASSSPGYDGVWLFVTMGIILLLCGLYVTTHPGPPREIPQQAYERLGEMIDSAAAPERATDEQCVAFIEKARTEVTAGPVSDGEYEELLDAFDRCTASADDPRNLLKKKLAALHN